MFGLRRINRDSIQEKLKSIVGNLGVFCKWSLIAILVGVAAGAFSTAFGHCINFVTTFRTNHLWAIFFLPFAGMLIIYLYKVCDYEKNKGTDQVFLTVHAEKKDIPFRMAPLIFISTVLTHLCGGSAGREGAALQMGGSIGSTIGRILHLDEKDRIVLVMCGMSAAFSALFGTPMAATIFAMEVESVGIMYYAALLPCALSAIIASRFAVNMGISFFLAPIIEAQMANTYGFVTLANQFVLYAQIVVSALNTMASRFVTIHIHRGEEQEAREYFSSVFFGNVIMAGIFLLPALVIVIFMGNLPFLHVPADALHDVQLLWAFVFLNFFLSIIMSIYSVSTYAMNRLDLTSIRSMYADILRIIFLFGTFLLWRPALWLVGAASLISTCYTAFWSRRYTRQLLPGITVRRQDFRWK